jgi:hypothetical protein
MELKVHGFMMIRVASLSEPGTQAGNYEQNVKSDSRKQGPWQEAGYSLARKESAL